MPMDEAEREKRRAAILAQRAVDREKYLAEMTDEQRNQYEQAQDARRKELARVRYPEHLRYPEFKIGFTSALDLDGVCAVLSEALFLGLPFQVSSARDEVPCRMLR